MRNERLVLHKGRDEEINNLHYSQEGVKGKQSQCGQAGFSWLQQTPPGVTYWTTSHPSLLYLKHTVHSQAVLYLPLQTCPELLLTGKGIEEPRSSRHRQRLSRGGKKSQELQGPGNSSAIQERGRNSLHCLQRGVLAVKLPTFLLTCHRVICVANTQQAGELHGD